MHNTCKCFNTTYRFGMTDLLYIPRSCYPMLTLQNTPLEQAKTTSKQLKMTARFISFLSLMALVAAAPLAIRAGDGNEESSTDRFLWHRDDALPVAGYIVAAIVGLIAIAITYFAVSKYRRGEPLCSLSCLQRKPRTQEHHSWHTARGTDPIPLVRVTAPKPPRLHPRLSINKPLPSRPADPRRDPKQLRRKPVPGAYIGGIHPNADGFYAVGLVSPVNVSHQYA